MQGIKPFKSQGFKLLASRIFNCTYRNVLIRTIQLNSHVIALDLIWGVVDFKNQYITRNPEPSFCETVLEKRLDSFSLPTNPSLCLIIR